MSDISTGQVMGRINAKAAILADFSTYKTASEAVRRRLGIRRLSVSQADEVRAAVAKHQQRATAKPENQFVSNRFLVKQTKRRAKFAVKLGQAYHDRIRSLYVSKRASVQYGHGGGTDVDHHAYAKSYGYSAHWLNAGARIEGQYGAWYVVLETSRGTEVARIPVDFSRISDLIIDHPGLTLGDLWGIERHGIIERYAWKRRKVVKIGVAVQFSRIDCAPDRHSGEMVIPTIVTEWEHGNDIADCRAENEHKVTTRQRQWDEYRNRNLSQRFTITERASVDRIAQRILRFCPNLLVSYQDARAVGHCDAGIRGWCHKHGIDPDQTATLKQLTGDRMAGQVAQHVAVGYATNIFLKRQRPSQSRSRYAQQS